MTREEYRKFLKDLEHEIFNRYPIIGATNAKAVVSKADMEKHSYSEYEVEQYAYDLADFVERCIANFVENRIKEFISDSSAWQYIGGCNERTLDFKYKLS